MRTMHRTLARRTLARCSLALGALAALLALPPGAPPASLELDRKDAPYVADEPGGRIHAEVSARLLTAGPEQVRLRLAISAVGPSVDPVPGFAGVAGANRITAREIGKLLEGDALAIETTVHAAGEPGRVPGTAWATRHGRIPTRKVDAGGRIQLDAWTLETYPLEMAVDSGALPRGPGRLDVRVEGVTRLRVTFGRDAILHIESFGGPPIDA